MADAQPSGVALDRFQLVNERHTAESATSNSHFCVSANNSRHYVGRLSLRPSERDAISPFLVERFHYNSPQIIITECEFLKRFSRSEVRGQGHSDVHCTFPADGYRISINLRPSVRRHTDRRSVEDVNVDVDQKFLAWLK